MTRRGDPPGSLVGRDRDLDLLRSMLDRVRAGESRVVLVEGAAGVGKTALLRRLVAEATDLLVLHANGAQEEQLVPYGVVDQLAHSSRTPLPPPLDELGAGAARNPDPVNVGAALVELVGGMEARGPVAILVDDVQWADRPSLLALLFALRRLQTDRVLALLAVRDGTVNNLPEGLVRLCTEETGSVLRLSGLDVRGIQDLAEAVLGDRLPTLVAEQLLDHTGGNPLHLEALMRELPRERLLRSVGVPLPAPRSYSTQIAGRLATRSPETQRLVVAASVLGVRSPLATAQRLAHIEDPLPALEEAMSAGLLEPHDMGTRLDIAFPHALTRAAVYHDIGPARRRDLHLAAAALVGGEAASLLHRSAATVDEDEILTADLADYGRREASRAAWSRAAAAMLRASELSPDPARGEALLLEGIDWLITAGDAGRAEGLAGRIARCRDGAYRRHVLGRLAFHAGRSQEGYRLLLEGWNAADLSSHTRLAGGIASEVSLILIRRANGPELLTWARRAMTVVGEGGGVPPWGQLAYGFAYSGRAAEGLAELSFLPDAPTDVRSEDIFPLMGRGVLRQFTDDLSGARRDFAAVEPAAARWGPSVHRIGSLSHLAWVEYALGAWDDALGHAELGLSIAEAADETWMLSHMRLVAGSILAARGEWSPAQAHADAMVALASVARDEASIADAASLAARIAAARGDHATVVATLAPLATMTDRTGLDEPAARWQWRTLHAEALIGLGRLEEAEVVVAEVERLSTARALASAMANAWRLRGQLLAASKEVDAAIDAFRAAGQHSDQATVPFDRARLDLSHGQLLRRAGRRTEAVSALSTARERFDRVGARPFIECCDTELAASGIRQGAATRGRPRSAGLTPQEGTVVRLLLQGSSNREIARQLVLSLNTIEYHLKNAYSKLGVSSRSQLLARLGTPDALPGPHATGSMR